MQRQHLVAICIYATIHILYSLNTQAGESIEYVAEHLLEVPMDTRALSLPLVPANVDHSHAAVEVGYGSFDAGKLNNSVPMLGAQYFVPLTSRWGILGGAFYDGYHFSGQSGKAVGGVLVVNAPNMPDKFLLDINHVGGSGKYTGASVAITYTPPGLWRWQLGYMRADMDIKKLEVNFTTTDLTNNFSGSFDYASHYSINTLLLGFDMTPLALGENFTYSPHMIIIKNSPRVGFQGRFSGPGFDYSGNTASNGHGAHIPDNYMGVGVNFAQQSSGIQIDLGATLILLYSNLQVIKALLRPYS